MCLIAFLTIKVEFSRYESSEKISCSYYTRYIQSRGCFFLRRFGKCLVLCMFTFSVRVLKSETLRTTPRGALENDKVALSTNFKMVCLLFRRNVIQIFNKIKNREKIKLRGTMKDLLHVGHYDEWVII